MKTVFKISIVFIVAAGLTTGCGALKTSKKNQKADQTVMELSGQWESTCQKQGWFDFTQALESYTFSALGDFETKTTAYRDDCKNADHVVEIGGTYDSLGNAVDTPNAKSINFTVSSASMTPKSDVAVKMLNALKYCAVADWAVDKKVDILNKDCVGINYKTGQVIFDIYRLNSNQLQLGRKMFPFAGEAAATRPGKIDESRIFTKK